MSQLPVTARGNLDTVGGHTRTFKGWYPAYGDRTQEIAFVCLDNDASTLRNRLEGCLLDEDELANPDRRGELPHPFPWPQPND
ncbi:MAG: hypothetical protein AAGA48_08940 [Myxococcota bacterium]